MSLTSFVNRPEIRDGFRATLVKQPPFKPGKPLLAPPLTTNYALVGTAFDYLLRFYLERLNPGAATRRWVATEAVKRLQDKDTRRFAEDCLADAEQHHQTYLQNGALTNELVLSSLDLAYLDAVLRAGEARFNPDGLRDYDRGDVEDLKQLMRLVPEQDFKTQKACHLNPVFGFASMLVGGADADLIIDDKLIDVKTTINLKLEPKTLYQLVGYFVLLSLGGLDAGQKVNFNYIKETSEINHLCVYFSRHGYLHKIKTTDLIAPESFDDFAKWFVKSACPDERALRAFCGRFHGPAAKQLFIELSDGKRGSSSIEGI